MNFKESSLNPAFPSELLGAQIRRLITSLGSKHKYSEEALKTGDLSLWTSSTQNIYSTGAKVTLRSINSSLSGEL